MNLKKRDEEYIKERIIKISRLLLKFEFSILEIFPEDLIQYFSFDVPTGDAISLGTILDNDFLLIHELVEISELKKRNLSLTPELFTNFAEELYDAHLVATEVELSVAKELNDWGWIRKRIKMIETWIREDVMNTKQRRKCKEIVKRFIYY